MRARALPVLAVLVLLPVAAAADTLTPWVSGTSPFLWITTLLLGVLEGAVLARLFRLKLARCIGSMIPANFLTSWIGLSLLRMLPREAYPDALGGAVLLVAVTFALTLVFEWPFVAFAVRGGPGWFRRSVKGSLIAQAASYGVLLVIGLAASVELPEPGIAYLMAMKSDLRNLATAQDSYFADHVTYAGALADLQDTAAGRTRYEPSAGNVVRILQASATGFSAIVRRDPRADSLLVDGEQGTTKTCGIFVGAATPPVPGQKEGEPKCR
jgi:hypothetical protein